MSDAPHLPPDESVVKAPPRSRNWPVWLGLGFFGSISVALGVMLVTLFRAETQPSGAPATATAPPPAAEGEAGGDPAADLRSRQQHVSQVVSDLGREVLVGDSPTRGNPEATVVLLEFSDFQCPYCARATTQVDAFMEQAEGDVLHVYKHLPLTRIHPEAVPAALASWAAAQQGQFWEFHDALFANQDQLGEALYVQIATDLGLDLQQFNRDRASEAAQAAIARDLALAAELQLNSTPTFLLNDLLIPGVVPADVLSEALARLQAASK